MQKKSLIISGIVGIFIAISQALGIAPGAYAATAITLSPLHQMKVLVPGKTETASFIISNPADNDEALNYELEVRPFTVSDENEVSFSEKENYSQIVNWIKLGKTEGEVEPNHNTEIVFTIDVPEDAPAGGQYATIIVRAKPIEGEIITEIYEMAHLIYAEVAGETTRSGEISNLSLSSFLLSGNITGGASVKNTGNVHSSVTHILKVLPLFSDEEYFTNEENPQTNLIMPGGNRYTGISWGKTPSLGVFRVSYSVEFEGVKNELSKLVIVCPIWLLFLIIAFIILIIIRIFTAKKRKA